MRLMEAQAQAPVDLTSFLLCSAGFIKPQAMKV
jgi:hypothetical protein